MKMMNLHCCMLFLLGLSCFKGTYSTKAQFSVDRKSIRVVAGDKNCITNCSRISAENNIFMECSVDDCKVLETSHKTSQKSEIREKEDIFLQKYHDDGEDRLALYVRWSPVDNVSMRYTKGYLINITDGASDYSTCYNFNTAMVFRNNAHDTYYNDCFGKIRGTRVVPGSEITVRITSLPLWHSDIDDGARIVRIEVPKCDDNEMMHSLPECQVPGGRPTKKKCISDSCDTVSVLDGKSHPISCDLSRNVIFSNIPEPCVKVNKTVTGTASKPVHIRRTQEWYKYIDPVSKNVSLALNFSWMPSPDSSISSLHHYYLEIIPRASTTATYDKCYSIHTNLTQEKHRHATFYYDCYGRSDTARHHHVTPGMSYMVLIESQPRSMDSLDSSIQFEIDVPDCKSKEMHDVCKPAGKVSLKVEETFCNNMSIKVNYSLIGSDKPTTVRIFLCETGEGLEFCKNFHVDYSKLPPSGILYASLKSSLDHRANLSIFIHPQDDRYRRLVKFFNFSKCDVSPPVMSWLIIMIVIACTLCVIALLSLVCYFHQGQCALKRFITSICPRDDPPTPNPVYTDQRPLPSVPHPPDPVPVTMPAGVRVYVVFMDDHPKHKEVVHWFCCFLKSDLGLNVRLNIWEEETVAMNQNNYMMKQMEIADKVIIICSAGTKDCLARSDSGDMITPVIRQACNRTFIGEDPGKFLVGYFPYSKPEHVPEMLHDQCMMYFSLFKLMKQFEQLYFRIVGVEQFQEGGIQRIEKIAFDRYFDPKLTSCGQKLKFSIEAMVAFSNENKTWYTDRHGFDLPSANIPPAPSELKDKHQDEIGDGKPSIVHMASNPPPGYHNKYPQKPHNVETPEPTAVVYRPGPTVHYPVKGKAGEYQKLSSVTSTDSSFILTESERLSPSTPDTPGSPSYPKGRARPMLRNSSGDNSHSFHPQSFNEDDYAPEESIESSIDSRLLESNITQITRLGLTESQEQLQRQQQSNLLSAPVFDEDVFNHDVPAGPVTLAHIDDNVEDFEDTFRTINFNSSDYQNSFA